MLNVLISIIIKVYAIAALCLKLIREEILSFCDVKDVLFETVSIVQIFDSIVCRMKMMCYSLLYKTESEILI